MAFSTLEEFLFVDYFIVEREWHGGDRQQNKCAPGGIAVLPLSLPMRHLPSEETQSSAQNTCHNETQ